MRRPQGRIRGGPRVLRLTAGLRSETRWISIGLVVGLMVGAAVAAADPLYRARSAVRAGAHAAELASYVGSPAAASWVVDALGDDLARALFPDRGAQDATASLATERVAALRDATQVRVDGDVVRLTVVLHDEETARSAVSSYVDSWTMRDRPTGSNASTDARSNASLSMDADAPVSELSWGHAALALITAAAAGALTGAGGAFAREWGRDQRA